MLKNAWRKLLLDNYKSIEIDEKRNGNLVADINEKMQHIPEFTDCETDDENGWLHNHMHSVLIVKLQQVQ